MKIAIVGPSPVPFTLGGMENMMAGLYMQINHVTSHQAELIKLPVKENSFWNLIDAYYRFYKLDVSHFDAVIVGKYPAWMIQHPNKIFYVAHRLRGLYDTYSCVGKPLEVSRKSEKINKILNYMEEFPHPLSLDSFFKILFWVKDNAGKEETPYFEFPGPLIRKIIHYLDDFAFRETRLNTYFAISDTVRKRENYFPSGSKVKVVYLPVENDDRTEGPYKHLFIISRLDRPKRIDVLIRAMKYVKTDIPLFIAGVGPEKEHLEKLAEKDARIHFLGFLKDEDVSGYYANALAIPYFPQQEDYGLITIEAMLHKKPVITTQDAGGPTEFVKTGETGFVVRCDPKAIGETIDYLANHPDAAIAMGRAAYAIANKISWHNVIKEILDEAEQMTKKRKQITVISTFNIYPPQGGGQVRTFNIFREIGKEANVNIISYKNSGSSISKLQLAPGLKEISIPRSAEHQKKIWELERKVKFPLSDIAEIKFGEETKEYISTLKDLFAKSDWVIFSHPYLFPVGKQYLGNKPFIYEAQDIEYLLKKEILPEGSMKKEWLNWIYSVEKECCEKSKFIITCSTEDKEKISQLYHIEPEKVIIIPNGVNVDETKYTDVNDRIQNKKRLGLNEEKIGIFLGSWHGPNLEACQKIFKIAKLCPTTKFLLIGSQCQYFKDKSLPNNVALMGIISERVKKIVLSTADFALNPMYSGSGTNVKMFDYMAAGLPIISTVFGTRGIPQKSFFHLADTVEDFVKEIHMFRLEMEKENVDHARKYVEDFFNWGKTTKILKDKIKDV